MMMPPQVSVDYPATYGEFLSWFAIDEDCRGYLT
jgi:hypothetical protein